MTATENLVRHCPKCGSVRVRRSRRRGPLEGLLASMGGEICRCHDCCSSRPSRSVIATRRLRRGPAS